MRVKNDESAQHEEEINAVAAPIEPEMPGLREKVRTKYFGVEGHYCQCGERASGFKR